VRRTRQALFSFLAIAIGAAVLCACGSGASAVTTTTTAVGGGTGSTKASLAAYSACLQEHGVKLPNFGGGPPSGSLPTNGSFPSGGGGREQFNSPAFKKAAAACASLRPKSFGNRGGRGFSNAAFAAYRNCLKIHGVTLPSRPTSSSNSTPSTTLNTKSPKVKAALAACASLLPKRTPQSGATTTTTFG